MTSAKLPTSSLLWLLVGVLACSDGDNAAGGRDAGDRTTGGTGGGGATGGDGGAGVGGSGGSGGVAAAGGTGASGAQDAGHNPGDDAGGDAGPQTTRCVAPTTNASNGNGCPAAGTTPSVRAVEVAGGFSRPIFVTAAPGDATRLFVVERQGDVKIVDRTQGNQVLPTPFISVPMVTAAGLTSATGERGLLGMAFHPDYPRDPRFFVNHIDANGDTLVRSFEVSAADPNVADASKGGTIVAIPQPASNHNGGMLAFGPDGCLYVGSGDGGGSNDQHGTIGNGQNLNITAGTQNPLLGKILRFDVDSPTTGAPGNLTTASIPHIWDYGLRNPWRFSFDRETGDLYIGDVGQGRREEVDVEARGTGKLNYGWKIAEGSVCGQGATTCDTTGFTPPVYDYPHAGGDDCIVGGYVYRGDGVPTLQGFYLFADNGSSQSVRAFVWNGTGRCNDETVELTSQLSDIVGDITSFGEDSDGELYITSFGNDGTDGRLYRIDPN